MADDDKGGKPETPKSVDHPSATGHDGPGTGTSVAGGTGADKPTQTEWTASDRRGPLDSASEELEASAREMEERGGTASRSPRPADDMVSLDKDQPALEDRDPVHERPGEFDVAPHETADATGGHAATIGAEPEASRPVSTAGASPARAAASEPERKRSLMPVAAGLVIGALIGAGSAWLVYAQSDDGADDQQVAALAARVDALDKRPDPQPEIAKLQSGLADVQGKVASMAKQPAGAVSSGSGTSPGESGLASKVAALQSSVDALKARTAPSASGAPGGAKAPAASSSNEPDAGRTAADTGFGAKVAALQASIDDLKTRTAALKAQDAKEQSATAKVASLQSSVAEAQKQAAGAQSSLDAVKGEQKQLDDKIAGLTVAVAGALKVAHGAQEEASGAQSGVATVQDKQKALEAKLGSPALAVVSDSLVQQIDAGQPFTRQVDALAALSADPAKIAVLRQDAAKGVPSAQDLLAKWKPLADPVIATGNKAPANANFGERLKHGLFGLVSVRRDDRTTGGDLTSQVNLIEADLAHDDVPGAYSTWQALPADAKAKSSSWGALAKTSVEALTAARDLQHNAIDALGAKKS